MLSAQRVCARKKVSAYFIGNSYTYTNSLPQMIADIAASMGDTLVFEEHDPGGWSLADHDDLPPEPCFGKILTGKWNYIVLQEQSQRPALPWGMGFQDTYDAAKDFCDLIRDSTPCTSAMFYMTWGYKNGDAVTCANLSPPPYNWPYYCTYESMDSIIRARYRMMADTFKQVVSPVGAVRNYIRHNFPGIELYQSDGSHPSVAGTYAAAVCFYTALFRENPTQINFNSALSASDATSIKLAAKKVVFDSLSKWFLGENDLSAGFGYVLGSGKQVNFTNTSSKKAVAYHWDFGDGSSSTLKNPTHTYSAYGSYKVRLRVSNATGCSKENYVLVQVSPAAVHSQSQLSDISIAPIPVTGLLKVHSTRFINCTYSIRIFNTLGQVVLTQLTVSSDMQVVDLSMFESGTYSVGVYEGNMLVWQERFNKQ